MKYGIGMNYILRMVMDWPVKMVIGDNDVDGKDSLLVRCFTYIYMSMRCVYDGPVDTQYRSRIK